MMVGCTYPYLSVTKDEDDVVVTTGLYEKQEFRIPIKYVEYEYTRTKEEIETDEKERLARRNERLNSPRCAHIIFDGTYNGYHIDVEIHPEIEDDDWGMARYHFKNSSHDFYIETAFTWDWHRDAGIPDEDPPLKGEYYHTRLLKEYVVIGEGDEFAEIIVPFIFKDIDFDGEYELLFRIGGYHGSYYEIYKIIAPKQAVLMSAAPFNNFAEAYRQSPDDDSIGIHLDYKKKTITINEPFGASDYNHDVWQRNSKSKNILNPMTHLKGTHIEGGAIYRKHIFLKHNKITKVETSYTIDSIWSIFAKHEKDGKDVKLVNIELRNAQNDKMRHTVLQWK